MAPDKLTRQCKLPRIYYATRTHSQIAQVPNSSPQLLLLVVSICEMCLQISPASAIIDMWCYGAQVVRELKRAGYTPRMAILVGLCDYFHSVCSNLKHVPSSSGVHLCDCRSMLACICIPIPAGCMVPCSSDCPWVAWCRRLGVITVCTAVSQRRRMWMRSVTSCWRSAPADTSTTCPSCWAFRLQACCR